MVTERVRTPGIHSTLSTVNGDIFFYLYDRDLHRSADGVLDRMTALQTWQKRQILISASFGMDGKCN